MAASYADIETYEVYFGPVSGDVERERVEALLDKASAKIASIVSEYDVDEEAHAADLEEMCCNLVSRRMRAASSMPLSSVTHQAGGFSETYNYAVSTRVGWQIYPEDYESIGVSIGGVACVAPWRKR